MKVGFITQYCPVEGDRGHGCDHVLAAIVTAVDRNTNTVNLCVFGPDGVPYPKHGLPMPDGDAFIAGGDNAERQQSPASVDGGSGKRPRRGKKDGNIPGDG